MFHLASALGVSHVALVMPDGEAAKEASKPETPDKV
jgi:hypothetical protein